MPNDTAEREVLQLENRFWDAMKRKDGRSAAQMTDDGCIIVGAQGVSAIDSRTMEKLTVEGDWQLQQYAFDETNAPVRFRRDRTAQTENRQ